MKKLLFTAILWALATAAWAQAPHLFEHTYPVVSTVNPEIRAMMDSVSVDSLKANIEHLSSYHTRRFDSRFIYDVQDWLVGRYQGFGTDTVMLHDFKVDKPGYPEETADNILAVQWGTKTPDEYVICGAHYDSWNDDGTDPDTIRSPGADDNATGVAGILETARILSRYTFDRTIIYANWCAEEIGLVGSAAYARDMAEQLMDIVGYFNLDMTGYLEEGTDIHVHLMYTTQDSLIADYVYNFSHVYFPEMPIRQNWLAWGDSDYSSFNRNGYPASLRGRTRQLAVHPHAAGCFGRERQQLGPIETLHGAEPRLGGHLGRPQPRRHRRNRDRQRDAVSQPRPWHGDHPFGRRPATHCGLQCFGPASQNRAIGRGKQMHIQHKWLCARGLCGHDHYSERRECPTVNHRVTLPPPHTPPHAIRSVRACRSSS